MLMSYQMRAPSKRLVTMASILLILLAALAWSFSRLLPRARGFEGAPASIKQKAGGRKQEAESAVASSASTSTSAEAKLIDSDNDGIPDVAELRTFQDRDSFRRWFTAIAENQFYQLSDQWNAEQRDCAGMVRFAMREALRRHDRIWFQKMGPGYETVAPDVAALISIRIRSARKSFARTLGLFMKAICATAGFQSLLTAAHSRISTASLSVVTGARPSRAICSFSINRGCRSFPIT